MKRYYLAIDIGASSGRHILGHMEDGKMVLEEIYRFPNGMQKRDGEKVWDIEALFEAVLAGMKKCRELGKIPVSVGIDTWAVDFVLLDKDDQRIGNAVAYRDDRTKGMDEEVYRTVPEEELYASTGIQKQIFNSIYQLMAWKKKCILEKNAIRSRSSFLFLMCTVIVLPWKEPLNTNLIHKDGFFLLMKKKWGLKMNAVRLVSRESIGISSLY